ncbi:hypothetical protein OUZ56_003204 [Daphnia magna]|uniref:Uncharacterized protein n=1 Tax=Daphnia magna TaxID=35525 RepID=A0ABR0A816_9CRUS|nr:hypothetical protein OUZ56_003204 [Daphnia magna]
MAELEKTTVFKSIAAISEILISEARAIRVTVLPANTDNGCSNLSANPPSAGDTQAETPPHCRVF